MFSCVEKDVDLHSRPVQAKNSLETECKQGKVENLFLLGQRHIVRQGVTRLGFIHLF